MKSHVGFTGCHGCLTGFNCKFNPRGAEPDYTQHIAGVR